MRKDQVTDAFREKCRKRMLGNQIRLGVCHNTETKRKMSASRSAEGNAYWGKFKDGETYSLPHNNWYFIKLRSRVYERDNYTCIKCKKIITKQRNKCCHHVDFDARNNVMLNLATLCKSCHMRLHWQHRKEVSA